MKPFIVNNQIVGTAIDDFMARVIGASRSIASRCGDDSARLSASINTLYQTALAELRPQFPHMRDDPKFRARICQCLQRIILIGAG